MAEEKKEPWLNYLALTTIIFAVCATLSTLKGGGFSTRSVMSQSQASDQWSYYQAKSIKGYIYDLQREKLELELKSHEGRRARGTTMRRRSRAYKEKTERYEKEKEEIKQKAEELEKQRDDAQKHSGAFGMAAMFLQIAILLSSIAALMKQKYFWFLGMASRLPGAGLFLQRLLPIHEVSSFLQMRIFFPGQRTTLPFFVCRGSFAVLCQREKECHEIVAKPGADGY